MEKIKVEAVALELLEIKEVPSERAHLYLAAGWLYLGMRVSRDVESDGSFDESAYLLFGRPEEAESVMT